MKKEYKEYYVRIEPKPEGDEKSMITRDNIISERYNFSEREVIPEYHIDVLSARKSWILNIYNRESNNM